MNTGLDTILKVLVLKFKVLDLEVQDLGLSSLDNNTVQR